MPDPTSAPDGPPHPLDRHVRVPKHDQRIQPQHAPPEARELSVAPRIGRLSSDVAAAIDFDGELHARDGEVDDVLTEDVRVAHDDADVSAFGMINDCGSFALSVLVACHSRGADWTLQSTYGL